MEGQETPSPVSPELKTPYAQVLSKEAIEKHQDKKDAFRAAFGELDRQVIENFKVNDFDGTKFTSTKISITPDVIKRIAAENPQTGALDVYENATEDNAPEKRSFAENEAVFCLSAFQQEGSTLAAEDVAIDAFFRRLPQIARAMKKGEPVPALDIYIVGQPSEYGGEIPDSWVEQFQAEGMDAYGKLFARFIEDAIPVEERQDTNTLLLGVSMGSVNADKTYKYLPEDIKSRTQRLFDNPAGIHKPGRIRSVLGGIRVASTFLAEGALRRYLDATGRSLTQANKSFLEYLGNEMGVPPGDPKNKQSVFLKTGLMLMKGSPIDYGVKGDPTTPRTFIRKGYKDTLTEGPLQPLVLKHKIGQTVESYTQTLLRKQDEGYKPDVAFGQELKDAGLEYPFEKSKRNIVVKQKGRSLEVPVDKTHVFIYENFDRWAKNLEYVQSPKP